MALVILPGLNDLIEDISEEKKLPPNIVEVALREALLKGYEKYRKTFYIGVNEDPLMKNILVILMSDWILMKKVTGSYQAR